MKVIYKVGNHRLIQIQRLRMFYVQRRVLPFIWITTYASSLSYHAEHEFRRVAFDNHVGEAV